jgi:hypothetical protein
MNVFRILLEQGWGADQETYPYLTWKKPNQRSVPRYPRDWRPRSGNWGFHFRSLPEIEASIFGVQDTVILVALFPKALVGRKRCSQIGRLFPHLRVRNPGSSMSRPANYSAMESSRSWCLVVKQDVRVRE